MSRIYWQSKVRYEIYVLHLKLFIWIHHHYHHHYPHHYRRRLLLLPPLLLLLSRYTPFGVCDWPIACQLFNRGDWVDYTQSTLTPTVTGQTCSLSHWACFSMMGPGWTVCHRSSTSAPILNLCEINHYQLRGSVSLCPLATTWRSPTMG